MENKVKGTRYDDGNNHRNCWYCSDNHQYYCHADQYQTVLCETETSEKQPPLPKVVGCFSNQ